MANSVRKNTVKLVFGPSSKVPSHLEVLKFAIGNLKLSAVNIHSIYKDENGGQFYVKLVDEPTFSTFIADSEEQYIFKYDDGSQTSVQVDQACRIFRYVRIFNLPPEIEDREIQYVLGQFGTIRQHVRERFPNEINMNIFTGVRGVHMEISKEIPAHLFVGHFRARIFYEGLKNKCFYCKSEGHEKSNCPKLAAAAAGDAEKTSSKGTSLGRPVKPVIDVTDPGTPNMTVLTSKHRTTKVAAKNQTSQDTPKPLATDNVAQLGSTTSPPQPAQRTSKTSEHVASQASPDSKKPSTDASAMVNERQNDYMDDEISEQNRALIKRTQIISSEGSDIDENNLREVNELDGKWTKVSRDPPRVLSKRNKK